jgi:hypothetical protein
VRGALRFAGFLDIVTSFACRIASIRSITPLTGIFRMRGARYGSCRIFYFREDLDEWLRAARVGSTSRFR